jgi:hypothetical protein
MVSLEHVPMGLNFLSKNKLAVKGYSYTGRKLLCPFPTLTSPPGSLFDLNRIPKQEKKNAT